nr:NADH dehydrogenase subunit 5 [Candidula unifasciata unifasciata]
MCASYSVLHMLYVLPSLSYMLNYDLISVSSSILSISVILDKTSLSFGALVSFISANVFFFSRQYMQSDLYYFRFVWLLFSFVLSMNILIVSGSYTLMLVGWDGLGVSSFALIIYYQSKESTIAGFLTLMINRLGDIIIMSTLIFFSMLGTSLLVNYPFEYQYPLLFLLALGALTKSAQYPFSVWLPAAMAAPTPVSALVHSSTLVTAGIYIIIRAFTSMSLPGDVMTLLLFCGSITSLIGGMCALVENDIKKIIALSTLSQLGVMMFSLGLGSYSLALLHLYTHAMFKALLFLVAGVVLMFSFGVQDIRLLGAVTKKTPILLVFMNISAFCLMGLPFLSSFYSKHVIISLMWSSLPNMASVVFMMISMGLTGLYMARLIKNLNWGNQCSLMLQPSNNVLLYLPLCLLFSGSLSCGLFFTWIDAELASNSFLPSSHDLLLNLITVVGVIVGCFIINRYKANILVNMLYLLPVWYKMPAPYFTLSTSVKFLDLGWLEPYNLNTMLGNSSKSLLYWSSWSKSSLSALPFMFLFGGMYMFMLWVYLKH